MLYKINSPRIISEKVLVSNQVLSFKYVQSLEYLRGASISAPSTSSAAERPWKLLEIMLLPIIE
jgi:hypothetical protein